MAFRLKPNEPTRKGLRRVLRKELDAAMAELEAPRLSGEGLHEARKHIKKARAVIRLLDRDIDNGKAPDRVRHAGRLLSPMRDAEAMAENAAELCGSDRGLRTECPGLYDLIERQKKRTRGSAARHHAVEHAKAALARVRHSVGKWDWAEIKNRQLNDAIERSYKRARCAMKRATASDDAARFHAWRKRVKVLWYALRLVEGTVPALRGEIARLERVETLLGHDHNLFVLSSKANDKLASTRDAARISSLAHRRQVRLRRMALRTAAAAFKDSPKIFAKRLRP